MIHKHDAIYKLYPQVKYMRGNEAFDENGNIVEYDDELVTTEFESNQYVALRTKQYPSIGDQLDMLWHAIDNGTLNKTSDFYTAIKAVKDAHPKE